MALSVAEEVSETADNFVNRTLTFVTPAAAGVEVTVSVNLYTTTGVAATAGMISDSGGHTWVQRAGLTGDGSTGGPAILSTRATTTISSVTLTPGGSGNYCAWSIKRFNGPADVDDSETGSGSSTSPAPASMTSTSSDGLALSVISTRNQSVNQTVPSGWTAAHLEKDNSAHLATAIAYSPNVTSTGAVTAVWTTADGGQWYAVGVLFKAAAPAFEDITRIMGGTDGRGWFGNEALGGADSVDAVVFDPPIPEGYGLIIGLALYGHTPDVSLLSMNGSGNTLEAGDQISYGGGVGGSISFFHCEELVSDCDGVEYDATGLTAGDNGRFGHLIYYVVKEPDLVTGFKTATGVTNVQTSSTTVAPGTLTPATTDMLVILGWTNRGHSEDLLPLDVPAEFDVDLQHTELHVVTDSPDEFGSVHNSITQSGSFIATRYTAGTPYAPVVTFEGSSPTSGEVRSVLTAYNISGGAPVVGSSVPIIMQMLH
jgi:hypothetical protein